MKPELADKLLRWKQEIEDSKVEKNRLEGQRTELLRRLKEEFGVADLAAANKRLETVQVKLKKLEASLEEGVAAYEEKYG